jgi:hypothetical protein
MYWKQGSAAFWSRKELTSGTAGFLKAFQGPHHNGQWDYLSYVTLIRHEIQAICKSAAGESWEMKELKRLVLDNLDRRLTQNDITTLATLLDPGTKQAINLPHEERVS